MRMDLRCKIQTNPRDRDKFPNFLWESLEIFGLEAYFPKTLAPSPKAAWLAPVLLNKAAAPAINPKADRRAMLWTHHTALNTFSSQKGQMKP